MGAFNSKEYEWKDITLNLAGRDVAGIRSVEYKSSKDKEALYAKGNKPVSIQSGNKKYEGSIKVLQSELIALEKAAGSDDLLDISFDIIVVYGNPTAGDAIKTDRIRSAEFTELPDSINQGDKHMEVTLPIIALDVERNIV
jgi:hypothetical protein